MVIFQQALKQHSMKNKHKKSYRKLKQLISLNLDVFVSNIDYWHLI